jgi:hypothetical protein
MIKYKRGDKVKIKRCGELDEKLKGRLYLKRFCGKQLTIDFISQIGDVPLYFCDESGLNGWDEDDFEEEIPKEIMFNGKFYILREEIKKIKKEIKKKEEKDKNEQSKGNRGKRKKSED